MRAVAMALLVGVLVAPSGSSGDTVAVPLALAPIADDALHGCRAAEVEAVRGRLARGSAPSTRG